MTYNVFGGTLNLAQSINQCRQHDSVTASATLITQIYLLSTRLVLTPLAL